LGFSDHEIVLYCLKAEGKGWGRETMVREGWAGFKSIMLREL
jgi:hypothetical protein